MRPGVGVVGTYVYSSAALRPAPARAEEAARRVASAVGGIEPRLRVEHVGSTAVPGLRGKGIVDLVLLYPDGLLARARDVLGELGFQHQTFGRPFPEERPMRVGTVEVGGAALKLHVHVLAEGSKEASDILCFRDRLRADPGLRRAYTEHKRRLIAAGITEAPHYSERKGEFIRSVVEGATGAG